ncbi:MAG: metal ABC transporter permease [Planctomycetota bacterium]
MFREAFEILTFRGGFNTNVVLLGTTLLGVAAGVVGVFALLRKRSLVADALAHATLPGIGLAFLAAIGLGLTDAARSLPVLLLGAGVTGVLGVGAIQWLLAKTRLTEDAAIGLVLGGFFGAGVVVLSVVQGSAAGASAGLSKLIYGQTAAMGTRDVALMAGVAGAAVVVALLLLKEMSLVCFDEGFAAVGGWPVGVLDATMLALVVVVTVSGLQAVGLLLVVALLIIPAVSARFWTEDLKKLVVLAGGLGGLCGYAGSAVSALAPRQPTGAVIVLVGGGVFVVSLLLAPKRGVLAAVWRRLNFRMRLAADHLLERSFETREPGAPGADNPAGYALDASEVAALGERRGWGVAMRAMLRLHVARRGLGRLAYDGSFTPSHAGLARGRSVAANHTKWEKFLHERAGVDVTHLDWTVDQVEHVEVAQDETNGEAR